MAENSFDATISRRFISSSLKRQFFAMLVVFSIFINAFVPRFALSREDFSVLSQIICQQSTLLKFFSLSTLPLNIVNDIFSHQDDALSGMSKSQKDEKKEKNTGVAADFSIISLEKTQNVGKSNIQKNENKGNALILTKAGNYLKESIRGAPTNISPHIFVCLAFLIFFFMLPRSSVNDNYAIANIRNISAQLGFPSWVFYLSTNNLLRRKYNEII